MTGAHLLVLTRPRQRLALSKQHLVRVLAISPPPCTNFLRPLPLTELQGQNSSAVVGEMRDALIDSWA